MDPEMPTDGTRCAANIRAEMQKEGCTHGLGECEAFSGDLERVLRVGPTRGVQAVANPLASTYNIGACYILGPVIIYTIARSGPALSSRGVPNRKAKLTQEGGREVYCVARGSTSNGHRGNHEVVEASKGRRDLVCPYPENGDGVSTPE